MNFLDLRSKVKISGCTADDYYAVLKNQACCVFHGSDVVEALARKQATIIGFLLSPSGAYIACYELDLDAECMRINFASIPLDWMHYATLEAEALGHLSAVVHKDDVTPETWTSFHVRAAWTLLRQIARCTAKPSKN